MKYKNYQTYLDMQVQRAESKWARKPYYNGIFIEKLRRTIKLFPELHATDICCMGIRDGTEMFIFREFFKDATISGVDITKNVETVRHKGDTKIFKYRYDFNNLPEDWGERFDLIFSNSIDHSYKPSQTIKEWVRVCKNKGHILLEVSQVPTNIEYGFTLAKVKKLLEKLKVLYISQDKERKVIITLAQVNK